jgi:kynureninase
MQAIESLPVPHLFHLPENCIYLDGNSLGLLPVETQKLLDDTIKNEWGNRAIRSWNETWYEYSEKLTEKLAPIVGAHPEDLLFCDNVSSNLYKLLHACLKGVKGRSTVLSDDLNFPSDLYVLQGVLSELDSGMTVKLVSSSDNIHIPTEKFVEQIDADTALVYLTQVAFKSGFMHDMRAITEAAHRHGAMVLWDLSHSVGVVPIDLESTNVDMAVGCTYKYLNGGPGAPSFMYINKRLQDRLHCPVQGWFGSLNPFEFQLDYKPAQGIGRFKTGTPPILSMKAIEKGLDIINSVGIKQIRDQSMRLTTLFIEKVQTELTSLGFEVASPLDPNQRGSHVSLKHPEALMINQTLIYPSDGSTAIIPDFRAPDNIRFGFAPLYNSMEEVEMTVEQLKRIVTQKLHMRAQMPEQKVT